ncbi:MAG: 4Fe-4S binding protein [Bacteroidia bacterium]|nr:4Fe-4S binding protein [Bacteroidia bacterium]
MKKIVRILRPLFFVLFFVLVSQQALIVWLVLYALSLVFPALFGKRLYCTAVCPMNTLMLGVVWLKGKLGRLDKPTPKWLKSGWLAYVSLGFTVALFIISRRLLGRDLPVMLFWIIAAGGITLVYHPDVFHDLVCPYGVLQRLLARVSILSEEGRKLAREYKGFTMSVMRVGKKGTMPGHESPETADPPSFNA